MLTLQELKQQTAIRIRTAREVSGLTQTQLGRKLKWQRAVLSRIETGDQWPAIPQLVAIARALGIRPDTLLKLPTE